ncbi:MAG: alpha/beta hydrolase [Candidatus Nanopelagicales bacterium]
MSWLRGVLAGISAALVLTVVGCAGRLPDPVELPTVSSAVGSDPALTRFYAQPVAWADCPGTGRQCATLSVPRDYKHPDAGSIEPAAARVPARDSDRRIGSLVINPGGPGLSGVQALTGAVQVVSPEVRDVFDLVGVDPRGVGGSTPVDCVSAAGLDAWRSPGYDLQAPDGPARRAADAAAITAGCARDSGDLLAHVDTVSAARDLDIVRAVLGDDRLTYLGVSYGTELGATYAELFPLRVGRMVLDAGLDPTMDDTQRMLGLAAGFESALNRYVAHCLNSAGCPLPKPAGAAVDRVRALVADLADQPLPTRTARGLTPALAVAALMQGVADDQAWPDLSGALGAALHRGDGARLLSMADAGAGRTPDGHYPGNVFEASAAITCLDSPRRLSSRELLGFSDRLAAASPTFGLFLIDIAALCSAWPVPPTGTATPTTATGADPILVVGTTHDPAAPYPWSVALSGQLQSGALLTYDGFGHTAYGHSTTCITDAVDTYLLTGQTPTADTMC